MPTGKEVVIALDFWLWSARVKSRTRNMVRVEGRTRKRVRVRARAGLGEG